jgi:D-beta-D-heptose 7-phosphate kinase/D-beta-D-heptose 1-phosphate adenosyltransferase
MRGDYAPILGPAEIAARREQLGRLVATSGGYDPVHPGHISCLEDSGRLGDTLVAIVNGDAYLKAKKGRPFLDLDTRCRVLSALRFVDIVCPYEVEGDETVIEALRVIRPHVFTKGGDRADRASIAEWDVCEELGIELVTGVGVRKDWSSSDFLRAWGEHWAATRSGR